MRSKVSTLSRCSVLTETDEMRRVELAAFMRHTRNKSGHSVGGSTASWSTTPDIWTVSWTTDSCSDSTCRNMPWPSSDRRSYTVSNCVVKSICDSRPTPHCGSDVQPCTGCSRDSVTTTGDPKNHHQTLNQSDNNRNTVAQMLPMLITTCYNRQHLRIECRRCCLK